MSSPRWGPTRQDSSTPFAVGGVQKVGRGQTVAMSTAQSGPINICSEVRIPISIGALASPPSKNLHHLHHVFKGSISIYHKETMKTLTFPTDHAHEELKAVSDVVIYDLLYNLHENTELATIREDYWRMKRREKCKHVTLVIIALVIALIDGGLAIGSIVNAWSQLRAPLNYAAVGILGAVVATILGYVLARRCCCDDPAFHVMGQYRTSFFLKLNNVYIGNWRSHESNAKSNLSVTLQEFHWGNTNYDSLFTIYDRDGTSRREHADAFVLVKLPAGLEERFRSELAEQQTVEMLDDL